MPLSYPNSPLRRHAGRSSMLLLVGSAKIFELLLLLFIARELCYR